MDYHDDEKNELRVKVAQLEQQIADVHFVLDTLNVPRDITGLNRKLTAMGRIVLIKQYMPELWQHIKNEMDKYAQLHPASPADTEIGAPE